MFHPNYKSVMPEHNHKLPLLLEVLHYFNARYIYYDVTAVLTENKMATLL